MTKKEIDLKIDLEIKSNGQGEITAPMLNSIFKEINANTEIVLTTYAELKALRDESKLIPGQWYRMTDYVTIVGFVRNIRVVDPHPFDIIMLATDTDKLDENCYAALHEGDTYFANNKLEAWLLKYTLDNDKKYNWAISKGKGVIYRMIDEFGNDCPYDFKNIQFLRDVDWFNAHTDWCNRILGLVPTTNMWFYTFTQTPDLDIINDASLNLQEKNVFSNKILPYLPGNNLCIANNNVFIIKDSKNLTCYCNTFGYYCQSNTFGDECISNIFFNYVDNNTYQKRFIGNISEFCSRNYFYSCNSCTFKNLIENTIGGCVYNYIDHIELKLELAPGICYALTKNMALSKLEFKLNSRTKHSDVYTIQFEAQSDSMPIIIVGTTTVPIKWKNGLKLQTKTGFSYTLTIINGCVDWTEYKSVE